jgi:hypothetical protein
VVAQSSRWRRHHTGCDRHSRCCPLLGSQDDAITDDRVDDNRKEGGLPSLRPGDVAVGIEIRRPSSLQEAGTPEAAGRLPVATIVVRNVGAPRCLGVWGMRFTITDRAGKTVGAWLDSAWFVGYYSPGREKTFSYPDIWRCDRPGPFAAVATVGPYSASRRNLSRSQIAGHVHPGCRP